jgi:hypothetical protein
MENLISLIDQIAIGLYLLCAVGLIIGLRRYARSRQALSSAQFELEKELARYQTANAITVLVLSIEIALAVLAISQVVAPTLRENPPRRAVVVSQDIVETPFETGVPASALLEQTPLPDFSQGVEIEGIEDELNLQPFATPTLTPTPVGTIVADVPDPLGCDSPDAVLNVPPNGMVIFEATNVLGTATTDNFAFYRFELNGPTTFNTWRLLAEYTSPVENGELGQIVPSLLTPGQHRFRLSVFDITSNRQATCEVTIIISEPIPTATPIIAS